jgi:hypothetical protein
MVKRQVVPDWRRALELLADSADGFSEALLFAHGFTGSRRLASYSQIKVAVAPFIRMPNFDLGENPSPPA